MTDTQAENKQSQQLEKGITWWLLGIGVMWAVWGALYWSDNFTELLPGHDNFSVACFLLAFVGALAYGGAAIAYSKRMVTWRRIAVTFAFAVLGLLSVFLLSARVANVIEGRIDFPAARTRDFTAFLLISRAYQTHGKGQSWNIQTMPVWSNLDITQDDYDFMLAHRKPGDDSHNSDEISSKGYFCAKVEMQQAGAAVRVMHAGSRKLPKGTVIICPAAVSSQIR